MKLHALLFGFLFFLCACSTGTSPKKETTPWEEVSARFRAEMLGHGIQNARLQIHDFAGRIVFEDELGSFPADRSVPIFSASKWISSVVFLRLIQDGKLGIDDPISKYLRDRNGKPLSSKLGSITVRQLLSFTSDISRLPTDGSVKQCFSSSHVTLEECTHLIFEEAPTDLSPGSVFHYTDKNMSVLGLIAEKVGARSWQTLFEETLARPLGFTSEAKFYASPRKLKGERNPRPAAGLRLSIEDYAKFLAMIAQEGLTPKGRILDARWIHEMEDDQVQRVLRLAGFILPPSNKRSYGFGLWRLCDDPLCKRTIYSSRGLAGFFPWLDRTHRYYGILGVYEDRNGIAARVEDSATTIRPLIVRALHQ